MNPTLTRRKSVGDEARQFVVVINATYPPISHKNKAKENKFQTSTTKVVVMVVCK